MAFEVPIKGLVFWNVGCGDSISFIVDDEHWFQVDLNHKSDADKNDGNVIKLVIQ